MVIWWMALRLEKHDHQTIIKAWLLQKYNHNHAMIAARGSFCWVLSWIIIMVSEKIRCKQLVKNVSVANSLQNKLVAQ